MGIEKVGSTFYEYCMGNKVLKILLPINIPLLLITGVLFIVGDFISMGAAGTIIYMIFILSVLLTFAKSEYRILAIGLGLAAADHILSVVINLIRWHSLSWGSIFYILVWGCLALMAYKKSMRV